MDPPFSTRDARSFYLSLIVRYRKRIFGLAAFMILFALLAAVRLGAIGVVLDAVRIRLDGPAVAAGEAESEPTARQAAPAGAGIGDGTAVESLDRAWRWILPEGTRSPADPAVLRTPEGFERFLVLSIIALAVAAVALGATSFAKETIAISAVVRMLLDTRQALFAHLTRQPVSYFHGQRAGDLISRVTNDVETVQTSLHHIFSSVLQQPAVIIAALAVALWASPFLFLISVPILCLMVVPVLRSGRKVLRHGRRRQQRLGLITESLQQLFGGIRIVRAFGMEEREREEFDRKNRAFGHSYRKTFQAQIAGRSLQEVLYNAGLAGMLFLGGWLLTTQSDLSLGRFFTFITALIQVYNPLKTSSKAWNKIQESRAGVERVLEILRTPPALADREGAREFPGFREAIRFDGVSFAYEQPPGLAGDGESPARPRAAPAAVESIDLEAARGQVVALVGPSGSGKTTLVDLLARFYDPQEGAILVDGVDIREYRHRSYLESIAIVSQDPFLFNTTIRENIRYGRRGATDADVEAAARAANAHDFILAQPEGYETKIGDRGAKLSGGQRQRLTIARALLKNAPILILDEATSALDTEAEREVQKAIDNLVRDRTTFVIAHRLSTVQHADKIVVLDRGRIAEEGAHAELLARGGRYHALYTSQTAPLPVQAAGSRSEDA